MKINKALAKLAVPIDTLKEDRKNARAHGEKNVAAIADSLREFGQQKPIVVLKGVVIAGNGTLRAAKSLGWKKIAAVQFEDAKRARAYAIADNRTAELASWDAKLLQDTIALLKQDGIDPKYLGFSEKDLKFIAASITGGYDEIKGSKGAVEGMFIVIVECKNESDQSALLKRLMSEGRECRAQVF